MHRLLEQQVKKVRDADGNIDLAALLPMISTAYEDADREQRLNHHALNQLQTEVENLYRRAREDADSRFNVVMENMGEAVVIIDQSGRITSFNAAAERIFGYPFKHVHGQDVAILLPDDVAAEQDGILKRYMETGKPTILGQSRELTGRRSSGEIFPIEATIGEAREGKNQQFIAIVRDITDRKQAEKSLKESENRFRDLVGSASDWFWETGPDHRLTFVSERINLVLGVNASAIVGLSFFDLGMADVPELAAEHAADLEARQAFRDRVFHVGPQEGKDSRTIRISGVPIHSKENEFLGYRGVGIDVTREAAAEQRARQAQQRLADAIESLDDGIALYDGEDRLVLCNDVYRRVFSRNGNSVEPGVRFSEVLRANADKFVTDEIPLDEWLSMRMDHHREAQGDPIIVRMSDGRWFLNRDFRTADGGVVSVRTDITQLKEKQHEIESLKRRYEMILDSAGEGIVGLDSQGRITFANRAAHTILGWRSESGGACEALSDLAHSDFHAVVQPGQRDGTPTPVVEAYSRGIGGRVSGDTFRKADAGTLPVDYYVAPITEEAGAVTGAVVVFRDATLRQQYERTLADSQRELERLVAERTQELSREVEVRARTEGALRDSRERLKGITNALFEGVVVINRDGVVAFANPSAKRLLQVPEAEDIEGLPPEELFRLDGGAETSPWAAVIAGGATIRNDDASFVLRGGTKVPVAFACSPSADNATRAAILSFRDIAALKDAQREALQASRMASVGQLAAGIAHEINTPTQYVGDNLRFIGDSFAQVAAVVRMAGTLADKASASGIPEAKAYQEEAAAADLGYLCEEIPTAVSQSLEGMAQVSRIVLSMKEFSHPGSSRKSMADVNQAIANTLTVSRNTWKHVAEVVTDFDPDLPQLLCYAGELNQVFLNLIVNAAHAIEDCGKGGVGRITITTRREGAEIVILITDTGNGVPEDLRERIFDPFFTTKQVGKGTGQGLAICRDVVIAKHQGRLDVGGEPGQGAVFSVRLPLLQDEEPGTTSEKEVTA